MASILDYLTWRGDLTFAQSPFNPVDNIILSLLSYFPFDKIVPGLQTGEDSAVSLKHAARRIFEQWGKTPPVEQLIQSKDAPRILEMTAACERFKHIGLTGYVNHIDQDAEEQFSAVSFILNPDSARDCYIAFRGTDNTLVGWKEDLNMIFQTEIPSQLEAVVYVRHMAVRLKGKLRLGGHSKGGNLAAYAASFCGKTIQSRISAVYRNDAPGFNAHVIASEGYQAIRKKLHSFIPQSSVVGMLFEQDNDYTVVKSGQAGLMQHDAYSWEMTHNNVLRVDAISTGSRFVSGTFKEWIDALEPEQSRRFFETFYDILSSTQANSFSELTTQWLKNTRVILQSLNSMDKKTKSMMEQTFRLLLKSAKNNLPSLLQREH
jgi:hypothetical protein